MGGRGFPDYIHRYAIVQLHFLIVSACDDHVTTLSDKIEITESYNCFSLPCDCVLDCQFLVKSKASVYRDSSPIAEVPFQSHQ